MSPSLTSEESFIINHGYSLRNLDQLIVNFEERPRLTKENAREDIKYIEDSLSKTTIWLSNAVPYLYIFR